MSNVLGSPQSGSPPQSLPWPSALVSDIERWVLFVGALLALAPVFLPRPEDLSLTIRIGGAVALLLGTYVVWLTARFTLTAIHRARGYDRCFAYYQSQIDRVNSLRQVLSIYVDTTYKVVNVGMFGPATCIILDGNQAPALHAGQEVLVVEILSWQPLGIFRVDTLEKLGYVAKQIDVWDPVWWGRVNEHAKAYSVPSMNVAAIALK